MEEITGIGIYPQSGGRVLAICTFQAGGFAVHDCLLIQKRSGERIIAMPRNRKRQDIVHPVSQELRQKMTAALCEAYDEKMQENKGGRKRD